MAISASIALLLDSVMRTACLHGMMSLVNANSHICLQRIKFIRWHVKSLSRNKEEPTVEQLVDQLFELFDVADDGDATPDNGDGDGQISVVSFPLQK